jgi:hypothetical protein
MPIATPVLFATKWVNIEKLASPFRKSAAS